jgi:serine/threonine protein kinase/Tol biopolymer transport system component
MAASNNARSLHFGAFSLDLRALELTKGGTRIRVPEQSLQILAMLLERPGDIVTREELHAKLWPNGTIVEFEHSINAAMNRLRVALGDSADEPRFVETVPRRGYRFIFPVEPVPDEVAESASPVQSFASSGNLMGQTVSHYRVLEKLGKGAMGVVYKAEDLKLGRKVALKFLTEELSTDAKARERFQREARAASALNHPNICTVYEVDEYTGLPLIAMEYVAGKSLDQLIAAKRIPMDEIVSCAVQITDALAQAHAAGIIHRDLKPSNIMVSPDGLVKVLDFGLAKIERPAPEVSRTETLMTNPGVVMGTARYMSPEQALGREVDQRTDIFSIGVVLYELATGHPPFLGDTTSAVIDAILHKAPAPPLQVNPSLTPEVARIIEKALEKDRDLRYQTAGEMRSDLKRATRQPQREDESRVGRKSRLAWVAIVSLVLTGAAGLWWRYVRVIPDVGVAARVIPLTTYSGSQFAPALSPDGKQVAFSWNGEKGDNYDVYVKLVDAGTPLRLTTNPVVEWFPAWSPDGRYIAFSRLLPNTRTTPNLHVEIWRVPALGGPERKLGETKWPGISWSPDGNFLAVVDNSGSPGEPFHISLLAVETGDKRRLTSPKRGPGDHAPKFSPDGRTLAFVRELTLAGSEVYLLPISGGGSTGEPRRLTFDDSDVMGLDWTGDSRNIIYSSSRPGASGLWMIPASGGTPRRLAVTGENAGSLSVSRTGNRLVYSRFVGDANIWRIPGPSASDKTSPPLKLIGSKQQDHSPAFSPEGKSIAFVSDRTGSSEIWVCDSDGHNSVQVTSFGGPEMGRPRWSPDSRKIAFNSSKEGRTDIYIVGVDGGPVRRATREASNARPSWSRDGRWIYFGSDRSGEWQMWKVPDQGGAAIQVTKRGGREATESADGKFVYYAKMQVRGIWRVPVDGGEETQVLDQGEMGRWALTSRGIYVLADRAIKFYGFGTRQWTTIKEFSIEVNLNVADTSFTVSPDDRWILYTQLDNAGSDLMLVENYR